MPVELSFAVQQAAPRALDVPGVADDPRYPLVLAEAAFLAAQRGDLADMARYRAALESCETPLDAAAASYIEQQLTQVAGAEGRIDLWIEHAKRAVALLRELPSGPDLATALGEPGPGPDDRSGRARRGGRRDRRGLGHHRGEPRRGTRAVRARERRVRARRHAARTGGCPSCAPRSPPSRAGVGQGLLHSMLADVAERLGEHRLALEYWLDGASSTAWAGLSEVLGRTLRRIALLLPRPRPRGRRRAPRSRTRALRRRVAPHGEGDRRAGPRHRGARARRWGQSGASS